MVLVDAFELLFLVRLLPPGAHVLGGTRLLSMSLEGAVNEFNGQVKWGAPTVCPRSCDPFLRLSHVGWAFEGEDRGHSNAAA